MDKKIDSKKIISSTTSTETFSKMVANIKDITETQKRFHCAKGFYKDFKKLISKNEKSFRKKTTSRFEDISYKDLCDFMLEAMWCSEHIHYELCLMHKDVKAASNRNQLRATIEKWSNSHLSLWALCLDRNLFKKPPL